MPSVIITEVPLGLKVPQSWKFKNEVFQLESSEELFTNHFTGIHYHHPQCQTDEKWKGEPYEILISCPFRWRNRNLRSIILETNLIVLRKKAPILPGLINDATQADKISLYRSTSLANSIDLRLCLNQSNKEGGPSIWAVYPRHKVTKYVHCARPARPVEPVREKQRPQDASRRAWNICVWLRCSSAVWIISTVHLILPWKSCPLPHETTNANIVLR